MPVVPGSVRSASEASVLGVARLDRSGRLSVRPLLARLGWRPGDRVSIDIVHRAVVVVVAGTGRHALGSRGDLALPTAARQLCGIGPDQPVLVVAYPGRGMLVIHAVDMVTALLAEFHAQLLGDRDVG